MVDLLTIVATLIQVTPATPTGAPPPEATSPQAEESVLGVSTFADIEGSVGYSTNPQLQLNSSGQAFGRISIYAAHARQTARSSTVLSLYGENTTYTGRSGSQQLLRATASHQVAASETLQLFGNASASLDRGGQLGTRFIGAPIAPVPDTPDTIPTFPGDFADLSLVGGRTYRLNGQVGAQISLSQRDSMTLRSGATHVVFRGSQSDNDFLSLFAGASFNRRLNERASAGIQVDISRSDYSNNRSSKQINPQLVGSLQLSDRVALTGGVGVSFAENDDGENTERSVGLTFNGSMCSRSERGSFCARVARDHQSDTIAGASKSTTFDASYSHQIDQVQSIQFSIGASRLSNGFSSLVDDSEFGRQTYLRASGAYTRKLGPRLLAGVNVAARSLQRDGPDPKPDVSGSVFVRWRVGDLR